MKRVGMFVWNHFTNDARVLRECTTLSRNGYDVELICIDDPNDTTIQPYEVVNDYFRVTRVQRYPTLLLLLQRCYRLVVGRKWPIAPLLIIWGLCLYWLPILTVIGTVLIGLVLKTKVRVLWIRAALIFRMTWKGRRGKYDIYHANDLNTMPQAYISAKWCLRKRPLVYDSHEVQTSRTGYDSSWYKRFELFFLKRIDAMIVENATRAAYNEDLYGFYPYILHNYPSMKIQQIDGKIDLHKQLELDPQEKILLYQGGIQAGRGLEKLIEAFPLFQEGTLVFIGDGRIKEDLEKMVKVRQLRDKIKFIPKVPVMDLPLYTKNAYMGFQVLNNINYNHWSASSNKLFEYMMNDVPVVACDFPEIKRAVEESEVGITIDPHDPREIAKAVNIMLKYPKKRDCFSMNCKNARKKYNWELEQHKLINIYNKLSLEEDG